MKKLNGSYPFAIILCRYKEYEGTTPVKNIKYFEDLFINVGSEGMQDYWEQISGEKINLDGTQIFGWYYLPNTIQSEKEWIEKKKKEEKKFNFRGWRIDNAVELAQNNNVDLKKFYGVVAIYMEAGETGASSTGTYTDKEGNKFELKRVILDTWGFSSVSLTAHEVGHGLGFQHSYKYLGMQDPSHIVYGDSWDIMSAEKVLHYSGKLGLSGPGMNAVNLENAGWIEKQDIWTPNNGNEEITINPLYPLNTGTIKVINIPGIEHNVPEGDIEGKGLPINKEKGHYLIEFRTATGWDKGFQNMSIAWGPNYNVRNDNIVLIHWIGENTNWKDRAVLLKNNRGRTASIEGDTFINNDANLKIDIKKINYDINATIKVGPAPSLILTKNITLENSSLIEEFEYVWAGIDGYCNAKVFEGKSLQQKQKITITVDTLSLNTPIMLNISIGDKNLNNISGKVSLEVETKIPDLNNDDNYPYKTEIKIVEINYERMDNKISFWNTPSDGNFKFELWVDAEDSAGIEVSKKINIAVEGWRLEFKEDFEKYLSNCLALFILGRMKKLITIIDKIYSINKTNEPSPIKDYGIILNNKVIDEIYKNISKIRYLENYILAPFYDIEESKSKEIPWLELGWKPQRNKFLIPGANFKG